MKNKKRLTPEDWFLAAQALLKTRGPQYVAVRELGAALNVSTGSFYHHFSSRGDFVSRFVEHWGAETESAVSALLAESTDTLMSINERVNEILDHRLEATLRAWSLFDETVADQVAKIDNRRRLAIAKLYEAHLPKGQAVELANLHLCALAGAQFIFMNNPTRLKKFGGFVNQSAQRLAE